MRKLTINGKTITDESKPYVVAEIGQNHQGTLENAKKLFHAAKECGADAVKLQKRDNKGIFTKAAYNKHYDSENAFAPTYGEHREALEFGREEFAALKEYAQELGLDFSCTAFDQRSADFLMEIGIDVFKIASGDLVNTPLLEYVAKLGKPMIVSTGGAFIDDVKRAYDAILPLTDNVSFLQCTAAYPSEPEHMNLRVIESYRDMFPECVVGLSDHQNGIAMAVVAYTLGARVFEKHFTLNRAWKGTDHAFSLEPTGLRKMIRDLHRTRDALGNGVKEPFELESAPLLKMRKKIVAARDLAAGTVLAEADLALKCPGDGLLPYEWSNVVGKKLTKDLQEDGPLSLDFLE